MAVRRQDFRGKTVVITGASSGIGAQLCERVAEHGGNIVLIARRLERLEALAQSLSKTYGVLTLPVGADVRDKEALTQARRLILKRFNAIDVIIANAGFGVSGPVGHLAEADFKRQFDTNIFGVLHTVHTFLSDIEKTKGHIVLMGSILSYFSPAGYAAYNMSKFAVRALADALRVEMAPQGVAVTLICPGLVESELQKVDNYGRFNSNAPVTLPKLQMKTEIASKKMMRTILKRKNVAIITAHGKLVVFLAKYFPTLLEIAQIALIKRYPKLWYDSAETPIVPPPQETDNQGIFSA